MFLWESGGCCKSHLTQIIFHAVSKVFLHRSGDPSKSRVFLLAATGVAAININGNTIHSGLHIPCRGKLQIDQIGQIDQNTEHDIKSRFIEKDDASYPSNVLHIFAENVPVKRHNENRLKNIPGKLITIPAKDEALKNSKISDVREAQNRERPRLVALHQDLN